MRLYRSCLWHYHRKHPTADLCEHRFWRFIGGFTERCEYQLLSVDIEPPYPRHLHVIPVDASLTAEEAWSELCLMHVRATNTGSETWATIRCDGSECDFE